MSRQPSSQLEVSGLSKSFVHGRPVLRNVNLAVERGTVHALAGANGSGKSTLVKILAGYHTPDEGEIRVKGMAVSLPVDPQKIRRAGVRFVHQDNGFVAGMSVLDNMCLGRGYSYGVGWKIRWRSEAETISEALEHHNVPVDLRADAGSLAVSTKAKLAIIRALHTRPGEERNVIVLDEPTAAMGHDEAVALGDWLRELARKEGLGVLFIGHRPQELREISDAISVLRNGEIAGCFTPDTVSNEEIVNSIVGAEIGSFYPSRQQEQAGRPLLELRGASGDSLAGVNLSLHAGEILGVTGLQGSGFEDLPYLIFDRRPGARGSLVVDGEAVALGRSTPAEQLRRGVALVPGDRLRQAAVADLTVRDNVSQPRLRFFRRAGFIRRRLESRDAAKVSAELGVTPPNSEMKLTWLSGGNQQKVVLGKWLATAPRVLLMHEPTEGVDVGAKREIFAILSERARQGVGVLVASIEYEDLANICDRILVFGNGEVRNELKADNLSGAEVMRAAYAASLTGAGPESAKVRWAG